MVHAFMPHAVTTVLTECRSGLLQQGLTSGTQVGWHVLLPVLTQPAAELGQLRRGHLVGRRHVHLEQRLRRDGLLARRRARPVGGGLLLQHEG